MQGYAILLAIPLASGLITGVANWIQGEPFWFPFWAGFGVTVLIVGAMLLAANP